ncbi:MAG TPA: SDR family oxidoreductase [Alphaproteobacteria bacterium]|nr:SDR family oxidoreductase [Alphaproteobacteria bacterium]
MATNLNQDLTGKTVLVTGASSGIGEATARHLAAQGANVVLGARRTDRLKALAGEITAAGGSAIYRTLDVTDLADMQAFVDAAVKEFGKIDVIVNNAGLMPLSPFDALKIDEWNRMIDVNVRGVLHGIAAGLPLMKKQGSGQFVNIGSIASHGVWATTGVYSATKYAVHAISEGLRQENENIRVTMISPGVTESELAGTITHESTKDFIVNDFRKIALPAEAIAKAVGFAIAQPDGVDVNEIIVRPTASPY